MSDNFSYYGFRYRILNKFKKEVLLIDATGARDRFFIPKEVEYDGKMYKVVGFEERKETYYYDYQPADKRKKVERREGEEDCTPFSRLLDRYKSNSKKYNDSVTEIIMHDDIKIIPHFTFGELSSLKCIKFPKDLQEIPSACCAGCTSLISIEFPENLKKIGCGAFVGCSFEKITIPSSVSHIDECAFNLSKARYNEATRKRVGENKLKVVNILNDEGKVVIDPLAFPENVKINYLGKSKGKSSKSEKKKSIFPKLFK